MTRFALCLLPLLALAACGPDTDAPPAVKEIPLDEDAVPDSVAGTYTLYAVNEAPLPGRVGERDGCEVDLTEGTIKLGTDALYTLDVLSRTVCEDENDEANMIDRATSEGPFVMGRFEADSLAARVDSLEIRFSREITRDEEPEEADGTAADDPAADDPDAVAEAEDEAQPDLFDAAAFEGTGVLRDTLLTVRLADDATTLTFVKE